MRNNINRYPVAQEFKANFVKSYKCKECKDTGYILTEQFSEKAKALYGENNDGFVLMQIPCPTCEAEKAKKLFQIHPKEADPNFVQA